jgi:hypothetical protein
VFDGADSIKISNFNNSFHAPNFAIGSTSEDTNNTLSVTGNIKATTGITGSYLTDNKLLTAGSVGQIESSAITWDDTTLTVGSSGAGHVYATQVTASEVKISSLAADRIVFTNADKQLEDSTNLQYDDDGGLNVGGKLTLTGDLQVSHNLTVQGTASFQHTEDLDVADRFIRMASGSTSTGDGGIAIQQTGPTDTEGFGYDSGQSRWGVTSSFDASQNALAPVAFMPLAINGTDNNPTSNQVGLLSVPLIANGINATGANAFCDASNDEVTPHLDWPLSYPKPSVSVGPVCCIAIPPSPVEVEPDAILMNLSATSKSSVCWNDAVPCTVKL